jgi:hypothetical protein
LLDGHVGVEVGVGAVGFGVSEPERDDGNVDSGGKVERQTLVVILILALRTRRSCYEVLALPNPDTVGGRYLALRFIPVGFLNALA